LFSRKKTKDREPELPMMPPAGITVLYLICFLFCFCGFYKVYWNCIISQYS